MEASRVWGLSHITSDSGRAGQGEVCGIRAWPGWPRRKVKDRGTSLPRGKPRGGAVAFRTASTQRKVSVAPGQGPWRTRGCQGCHRMITF